MDRTPKIYDLQGYQKFFDSLKEGEEFELRIRKVKDSRTAKMNNLYWLWMSDLSEFSGYTKTELHNYFKKELLCVESKVNNQTILNCESTADLSIKDFSNYLKQVTRLSAQNFSFVLRDPEQLL
jgi:hypothetical protein